MLQPRQKKTCKWFNGRLNIAVLQPMLYFCVEKLVVSDNRPCTSKVSTLANSDKSMVRQIQYMNFSYVLLDTELNFFCVKNNLFVR